MDDAPTEAYEHTEHAQHAAHSTDRFVPRVAMTIAILAVLAASVGSLETIESGAAAGAKTESVLFQNKATDNWNFFEAKSLKKNMYEIAEAGGGPKADAFRAQAASNEADSVQAQKTAKDFEARSDAALREAERHEARHHLLTIAIITGGRRWPWYASLALGVVGTIVAGASYVA